jgi:site-specific recombinase XerD
MTASAPLAVYVRSFFEDYLVCQRNLSRNTIGSYRDALKLLLNFASQDRHKRVTKLLVSDVTDGVVLRFLDDLEQSRGCTIQTRNHRLVAIRNLFEYIATREPLLLGHCQTITALPSKRGALLPQMQYLEKEEVSALLDAVCQKTAAGRRDYTMLLFLYNTGARVQEVADLRVGWLTLTAPFKVELLGKGRKWRSCPLWESTAQQLQGLLGQARVVGKEDDRVFVNRRGGPLSRFGIAHILEKHVAQAAVAKPSLQGKTITPHTLRHTTAMHLLQSGVEVNVIRSWLGHASIATTNRYVEIDLAMKREALQTCEVGSAGEATPTWEADPDILAWLESL